VLVVQGYEYPRPLDAVKFGYCIACNSTGYPAPHTEMHTITFQPGPIGLTANWQRGVVYSVDAGGQAAQLGVKKDWVIYQVNDKPYTEASLLDALNGNKAYTLQFKEMTQCPSGYTEVHGCPDCQQKLQDDVTVVV